MDAAYHGDLVAQNDQILEATEKAVDASADTIESKMPGDVSGLFFPK
jgi:hypothetical protein